MRKVLVIIDMQNDFTSGVLGNERCEAAVGKVCELVEKGGYDSFILTRDTHKEDYMNTQEGSKLPVPHCIEGSEGWQIREEIMEAVKKAASDDNILIIDKPTFGSLELGKLFEKEYSDAELHFCGVCTGICVISNVALAKAALPEVKVCVAENACACVTEESHRTAIEAMKTFQVDII